MTGLRVCVDGNAVAGVCDGRDADFGIAGHVLLPVAGRGPMWGFYGPCLRGNSEASAGAEAPSIAIVEAFLLGLAAAGCRPRFVESEVAA